MNETLTVLLLQVAFLLPFLSRRREKVQKFVDPCRVPPSLLQLSCLRFPFKPGIRESHYVQQYIKQRAA